ncbi:MAG: hypothetical protein IJ011_05475 [Clostridia bacterium]|nr:hypothetical protein [Clostridia bacterium]
MKKILCALLCLIMLLGVLVSCKNDTPDNKDSGSGTKGEETVSDVVTDTETETTRTEIVNEDFSQGGVARDYTMYVRKSRNHYLYAEKDSTDKVVSGTYKRNMKVQEDFGVNIKIKEDNGDTKTDEWITALANSGSAYDLAVPDYWWLLEQQGLFLNLYARDELAFNQDYWYSQWNDNVTINNKLYTVAGDASLEVLENIEIVFFNKDMTDTLGLDMYQIVNDKKWTIDKMLEIGKQVSAGMDTADTTDDDVYGAIYDVHSLRSQLISADLKLTEIKDNGTIELIAESRALNLNIQAKVKSLIHDTSTNYFGGGSTARTNMAGKAKLLGEKKAAFYATCMYAGSTVKKTGANYGVIPMPMYEEGGEYISTSYGVSTFAIPKTAADYHFSAVILDALNYHSYNTVVTGFFDTAMKAQIADSPEDARMMDIARESLYFDFAWMLDQGGTMNVFSAYQKATSNPTTELSSELTPAMQTSITGLANIIAFYNQE